MLHCDASSVCKDARAGLNPRRSPQNRRNPAQGGPCLFISLLWRLSQLLPHIPSVPFLPCRHPNTASLPCLSLHITKGNEFVRDTKVCFIDHKNRNVDGARTAMVPSIGHRPGGLTENTDTGHSVRRMPKLY